MSSFSEPGHGLSMPNQPVRSVWSIGQISQNLEKGITCADAPILRIDLAGIKDRKASFRKSLADDEPPHKRMKTTSVHAQCLLTIWASSSSKKEDLTYLVKQSQSCVIVAGTRDSGERTATVTMESPFYVKYEELLIKGRKPLNGYSSQLYEMQMTLLPANATDPWPPMDFLSPSPRLSQRMEPEGLVRFPMLLAQWRKLPQLPDSASDSLLEAMAYQDGKRYKTKLSLRMEAAWSAPSSPLSIYNASLRDKLSPLPHLPSPVSEEDPPAPVVSVTWTFVGLYKHIHPFEFDGYLCPLCSRRTFANMDAYHFHLITGHELLQFEVSVRARAAENRQQKIDIDVVVDTADTFSAKASNNASDEREMNWQSPHSPFDLEAFLKGKGTWLGQENKKTRSLALPRPILDESRSRSDDSVQHETPIAVQYRAAQDVPDLPIPARKKFRVPAAPPDIKFFRLTVKRPLMEGECISESDDDMDESWLIQKHNDTIESFCDMSRSEKLFIQRYDCHMLDENLSSNLHFREALVRFCRLNRKWLRQKDMRIEFHKKAARLLVQGSVSVQLLRDCVKIIGTKEELESKVEIMDTSEDESPTSLLAHTKPSPSTLPRTSREHSHSPTEAIHNFGRCKCGSGIYDMHSSIRCSNIDCRLPEYHLRCAGLLKRTPGWLCPTCETSSTSITTNSTYHTIKSTIPTESLNSTSPIRRRSPATQSTQDRPPFYAEISTTHTTGNPVQAPSTNSGPSPHSFPSPSQPPAPLLPPLSTSYMLPNNTQARPGQTIAMQNVTLSDTSSELSSDSSEEIFESSSDDAYEDDDFTDEEHDLMISDNEHTLED